MSILLTGLIVAAITCFYKPVGYVIALISILPLAYALVASIVQVSVDPTAVKPAVDGIAMAAANYVKNDIMYYPGAALFGALIGLFSPSS